MSYMIERVNMHRLVLETMHTHLCSSTLAIIEVGGDGNNSILYFFSQKGFCSRLHLLENHGGDLFRCKPRHLSMRRNLDKRLVIVRYNLVWHQLLVGLNGLIRVITTDEALHIKYGVLWVNGGLILGCITDETLSIPSEGHVGWCDTVSLIVVDNVNFAILVDSDARVSGAEIDANRWTFLFFFTA